MRRSNRIVCVWLLLALSCIAAMAQTAVNSGLIRGGAVDSSGAVIPGATITLISRTTRGELFHGGEGVWIPYSGRRSRGCTGGPGYLCDRAAAAGGGQRVDHR